jgi:hypothetical protein
MMPDEQANRAGREAIPHAVSGRLLRIAVRG